MTRIATAALLACLSTAVSAREVEGVKVADTLEAGGRTLLLNGAGVRKKSFLKVKVYVGALYLGARSKDAQAIVAADEPKAVRMVFLRDVDRDKILDAFKEGFENNSRPGLAELLPKLELLRPAIPVEIKERQVLSVVYEPGRGSTVGVEGGATVTVEGKDFADALFRNWLGQEPADTDLKEGMLAGG
jgi:chalcone isomerase-like protein